MKSKIVWNIIITVLVVAIFMGCENKGGKTQQVTDNNAFYMSKNSMSEPKSSKKIRMMR